MPQKLITFSSLTGQMVPEGTEVKLIIRNHPTVAEVVQLDAGAQEVSGILENGGQYVVLDIQQGDSTKQVVVDLDTFNGLFKEDPYAALKDAKRVTAHRGASAGNGKRDPLELVRIRSWVRENGWPDVKDRGRIPAEAEAAYRAANAA